MFWAATDDADFAEARDTWVAGPGGGLRLSMPGPALDGLPMHEHPLGDVSGAFERLAESAGSAVDPGVLDAVRLAYHPGQTVGGAYLTLLRVLLQPLGIAVLDASHPALLAAERPWLERALTHGSEVESALLARSAELRAAGVEPQVADGAGGSAWLGGGGPGVGSHDRLQRLQQAAPAQGVTGAGASQGVREVTHVDEFRQRSLQGHLPRAVEVVVRLLEGVAQSAWHDQITQLQPGVQDLGKTAQGHTYPL